MAAPSAWTFYNLAKRNLGLKVDNYSTDTFKLALFTSASNANSATLSPCTYATLTNELTTANGYTLGGATLTGVTWTDASGTETFTYTGGAAWTASGAGITARYAVIYDSTSGDAVCWCTLDSTPADVTTASGNQLTISASGSGVFTLA